MDLQKLYESFVGNGKIQAISLDEIENGKYRLKYKEGNKHDTIESEDRDFLEKMLLEFGGKNPDTCGAPDIFLVMDGSWDSEDLLALGHRITKITLMGNLVTRKQNLPVNIPNECGERKLIGKNKASSQTPSFMLKIKDQETCDVTMLFSERSQFDNLQEFVLQNESLRQLRWHIRTLGTQSTNTKDQCVWSRVLAGDGTQRMVLQLMMLNGKNYTECMRKDLHNAADEMFDIQCTKLTVAKKQDHSRNICQFAAENGRIDLSDYNILT